MNFIFHRVDNCRSFEDLTKNQFENFCKKLKAIDNYDKNFLITFDDGNKSDIEAAEIARFYGLKTAHFIITSNIGKNGFLSEDDILDLSISGALIGTHTHNHVPLLDDERNLWRDEVYKSCRILGDLLGSDVKGLSVPYGLYTMSALSHVKALDLKIYTSDPYHVGKTRNVIDRLGVNSSNVGSEISDLISSHYSYKRAMLFYLKDLFIKNFGRSSYLVMRDVLNK